MDSSWNGFRREDFRHDGVDCLLVRPERDAPGKPWVWRCEFFGAFAQADLEMLRRGWHVAYARLSDQYGCPKAVREMADFHGYMVERYGLNEKPFLFGFSRGGLYAVNFVLAHPRCVGGLYLDAPVLDIRSWPCGAPDPQWAKERAECLDCYGLTEETLADFRSNPLERAEELAASGLPVLLVAGLSDAAAPYERNGEPFAARFAIAGGRIRTILKPGCGHHPHSLEDPAPIADFLESAMRRLL